METLPVMLTCEIGDCARVKTVGVLQVLLLVPPRRPLRCVLGIKLWTVAQNQSPANCGRCRWKPCRSVK